MPRTSFDSGLVAIQQTACKIYIAVQLTPGQSTCKVLKCFGKSWAEAMTWSGRPALLIWRRERVHFGSPYCPGSRSNAGVEWNSETPVDHILANSHVWPRTLCVWGGGGGDQEPSPLPAPPI